MSRASEILKKINEAAITSATVLSSGKQVVVRLGANGGQDVGRFNFESEYNASKYAEIAKQKIASGWTMPDTLAMLKDKAEDFQIRWPKNESAGEYHVFIKVPSRNAPYLAYSCNDQGAAERAMGRLMIRDKASGGCIKKETSSIEPHNAENIWNQGTTTLRQGNIDTGGTAGKGTATHESKGTVFFWLPNSTKAEEEEVEATDRGEAMAKIRKKYPEAKAISCHMNDFKNESPKTNEAVLTYHAFYKGKKIELTADSSYDAQKKAAAQFKAKHDYDVTVMLVGKDDEPVVHSGAELPGS